MLLDLILSLGVRRQHTLVFLNTPPCYSYCTICCAVQAMPDTRQARVRIFSTALVHVVGVR